MGEQQIRPGRPFAFLENHFVFDGAKGSGEIDRGLHPVSGPSPEDGIDHRFGNTPEIDLKFQGEIFGLLGGQFNLFIVFALSNFVAFHKESPLERLKEGISLIGIVDGNAHFKGAKSRIAQGVSSGVQGLNFEFATMSP